MEGGSAVDGVGISAGFVVELVVGDEGVMHVLAAAGVPGVEANAGITGHLGAVHASVRGCRLVAETTP